MAVVSGIGPSPASVILRNVESETVRSLAASPDVNRRRVFCETGGNRASAMACSWELKPSACAPMAALTDSVERCRVLRTVAAFVTEFESHPGIFREEVRFGDR